MKYIRCVFNSKRMRIIPLRYFVLVFILLLIVSVGFSYSLLRQYESKENTTYVAGTISNMQCVDTFNVTGSRFLLLFEVNDKKYYIWYPTTDRQVYEHLMDCNSNANNLYAELLVSQQFGKNRVVDFRCDGQVLFSITAENELIRQEKLVAFGVAMLALILYLIIQFVILVSYKVIKFRIIKYSTK